MTVVEPDARLSVYRERQTIERQRSLKTMELLKEYDATIYHPALQAVKERCAAAGHGDLRIWDNGLGWAWHECHACRSRVGDAWETWKT